MSLPDIERVVSDYLRTNAGIVPLGTRIVGKTPDSTAQSWVKVTRITAPQLNGSVPDYLIPFLTQFDCYAGSGGGQPEANQLGDAVREALTAMSGTYSSTVVSCARIVSDGRVEDPDLRDSTGHPRERRVLTAEIYAHI